MEIEILLQSSSGQNFQWELEKVLISNSTTFEMILYLFCWVNWDKTVQKLHKRYIKDDFYYIVYICMINFPDKICQNPLKQNYKKTHK